jgi:hypothetical protein
MVFSEKIRKIQEQFELVIHYSQEIPKVPGQRFVNTDSLFEEWLEAKRDFIEAFGGKLIVELPGKVTFELSQEEKIKRVKDFLTAVDCNYDNPDLARFIDIQKSGFYENKVVEDFEYNGEKIPKGMKVIKAFKFFEKNPKKLENLQNAASMLIQEDKITGVLCLSVHPLDYISASENCHSWHSCHALDGDYRAGNLSYMVDKHTIMCYLRADNCDYILPDFPNEVPWNSKKWRVWIHLSDNWDIMFAGRQYPFTSNIGLNLAKKELIEPTLNVCFTDFTNQYLTGGIKLKMEGENFLPSFEEDLFDKYMVINSKAVPLQDVIVDAPGSLDFNDLLRSSCYVPQYAYRVKQVTHWYWGDSHYRTVVHNTYDESDRIIPKFRIGGRVSCVMCGNQLDYGGSFVCGECYEGLYSEVRRKYKDYMIKKEKK